LSWRGRSLGRLTADVTVQDNIVAVEGLRLVNGAHEGHGAMRCQTAMPQCRLSFRIDSSDASATLLDFGLAPELTAGFAAVVADLEWQPVAGQPWLAGLRGAVSLRLADGALRSWEAGPGDGESVQPFGLFAVPALVRGLDAPGSAGSPLTRERGDLHFARLEADFEVHDGEAVTSNLHFDGDAEILMRGRTGLVSRDYDQQVWVLRGEERLPAAVRRFGATPRVAAAWLSLRDLFSGGGDRARAILRLQGTWDDPMVVAGN
jgi:uncharacterized protein YhdP